MYGNIPRIVSETDDVTENVDRSDDNDNILNKPHKKSEEDPSKHLLDGSARSCPDLPYPYDLMCLACVEMELDQDMKELCLVDPCLVVSEVEGGRGECYKLVEELHNV